MSKAKKEAAKKTRRRDPASVYALEAAGQIYRSARFSTIMGIAERLLPEVGAVRIRVIHDLDGAWVRSTWSGIK